MSDAIRARRNQQKKQKNPSLYQSFEISNSLKKRKIADVSEDSDDDSSQLRLSDSEESDNTDGQLKTKSVKLDVHSKLMNTQNFECLSDEQIEYLLNETREVRKQSFFKNEFLFMELWARLSYFNNSKMVLKEFALITNTKVNDFQLELRNILNCLWSIFSIKNEVK